jgi:hypothetical protein
VTETTDPGIAQRAKTLHSQALEPEIAAGPPTMAVSGWCVPAPTQVMAGVGAAAVCCPGGARWRRRLRRAYPPCLAFLPPHAHLRVWRVAPMIPLARLMRAGREGSSHREPSQSLSITACHATCANGAPNGAHGHKIKEKQNIPDT